MVAIELRNITKSYGSTTALDGINLKVDEGQFLTLLGPTGCGKSTLLRIVAGFVKPTSGEVLIDGAVINDVPPNRRQTGLLFQNYALFPHMTVEQNVGFGLSVQGMSRAAIAAKVDFVLPLLGIEKLRTRYPSQLSGGQQQRTALARTLAIEPRVLLLDEPLAALDRKLKIEMQGELKRLISRLGITTICVSHDQDEALTMSDKIALLNQGKVEQFGAPLELYDRPLTSFAAGFLGSSNLISGQIFRDSHVGMVFQSHALRIPIKNCQFPETAEVTLMLRPEHLTFDESPSEQSLPGTVDFVTQFGHSTQYEIKLDAGPVFLVSLSRGRDVTPLSNGSRVFLSPNGPSAYQLIRN